MSHDKELEIRRQFLDEAQEYLQTLDATVAGLSQRRIDVAAINAALRAAHSIKGGAGMMGFQQLSHLAHRLEDGFKVLKTQHQTLEVDAALEDLLLMSVQGLQQVIDCDRQFQSPTPDQTQALEAVFDALHDRLGDPQPEDAASLLAADGSPDIAVMVFESEVEGCLQRLEAVLSDPTLPCLREEVSILAQELGGLGEMLQLEAFCQLCNTVARAIAPATAAVEPIARASLQAWRLAQAGILTGQPQLIPTTLALSAQVPSAVEPEMALEKRPEISAEIGTEMSADAAIAEPADLLFNLTPWEAIQTQWPEEAAIGAAQFEPLSAEPAWSDATWPDMTWEEALQQGDLTWTEAVPPEVILPETIQPETLQPEILQPETILPETLQPETLQPEWEPHAAPEPAARVIPESQVTDFRVLEAKSDPALSATATVRVSMRQLNQLNDLLSELTIGRNGMNLYLKRLRSLTQTLAQRVRLLDQSNYQMRIAYDRVASRSNGRSPLALAASNGESLHGWTGVTIAPPTARPTAEPARLDADSLHVNSLHANPLQANPSDATHFDSLEFDQYGDLHWLSQQVMETIVQIQEVTTDVQLGLDDAEQTARDLNKTGRQLQASVTHLRMRPLSEVVDRFPRALRDWCSQYGKQARFSLTGGDLLLDRTVLDALSDPLMHLFRNAFDHGIEDPQTRQARGKAETGTIALAAIHRGNRTLIRLSDDGNGIPLDRVQQRAIEMGLDAQLLATASEADLLSLIFEPGFSTSDQVTELSGRGVGMDVVRESLREIGGEITVDTRSGHGTTFTLSVPLVLSVVAAVLVESNGMLMAVPNDAIVELTELPPDQLICSLGSELLNWQGQLVPLVRLSQWFQFNCPRHPHGLETPATLDADAVLLVQHGSQFVAIQVDRAWGEQEVAIRRAEGNLALPQGFTGYAIIADGRVVPLLSLPDLLEWIGDVPSAPAALTSFTFTPSTQPRLADPRYWNPPASLSAAPERPAIAPARKPSILIVDDSINVRRFLALTLEQAGYRTEQAKDGQDALEKLQRGLAVQAIICDIEMPRLDGYGLLAQLKADRALEEIPVAMLTSRSGDKHRQLALNLGAAAYFSKPYNEQLLLQTLSEWTGLRSS